jgi:hypothetical protein
MIAWITSVLITELRPPGIVYEATINAARITIVCKPIPGKIILKIIALPYSIADTSMKIPPIIAIAEK